MRIYFFRHSWQLTNLRVSTVYKDEPQPYHGWHKTRRRHLNIGFSESQENATITRQDGIFLQRQIQMKQLKRNISQSNYRKHPVAKIQNYI